MERKRATREVKMQNIGETQQPMKRALPTILLCLLFAAALTGCAARRAARNDAAPQQGDELLSAPIVVECWTKPESGWLYILDAMPESGETGGRVWLVDPTTGKPMGSIRTDQHPDFALSPDGTKMYIASDPKPGSTEIAVVDTATGGVLGAAKRSGTAYSRKDLPRGFSQMALTEDGAVPVGANTTRRKFAPRRHQCQNRRGFAGEPATESLR